MNRWSIGKRKALMGCRGDLVENGRSVDSRLARCIWGIACRTEHDTSDGLGGAQQINASNEAVRGASKCKRLRAG